MEFWGDPGELYVNRRNTDATYPKNQNIYLVTSTGFAAGAKRTIEAEVTQAPPFPVPAAVYVEADSVIQGTSTSINGMDQCHDASDPPNSNLPGISTPLNPGAIDKNGSPLIDGDVDSNGVEDATDSIVYNDANLDIQAMMDALKTTANWSYTNDGVLNGTEITALAAPTGWGTPTVTVTTVPSSCSTSTVVYFHPTDGSVKFAGQVSGCGILLVEGDVEFNGGFSWYGLVVTTGTVVFSGGGGKNLTGALLSGGDAIADEDIIGGGVDVVYCTDSIANAFGKMRKKILSWREVM